MCPSAQEHTVARVAIRLGLQALAMIMKMHGASLHVRTAVAQRLADSSRLGAQSAVAYSCCSALGAYHVEYDMTSAVQQTFHK
jgi:hypothetical protein